MIRTSHPIAGRVASAAVLATIVLAGCATSGASLTQDHPLNQFVTAASPKVTAQRITEMSTYCSTGSYTLRTGEFPALKRLTIDFVVSKSDYVASRIEIDETVQQQSLVSVYDRFDNVITRGKAEQIERWLNGGSMRCVKGF